jgi:DNA-directed RNA polymerase specialized sigma24 family protein
MMAEPVTSTEDFETFYRRAWRDATRWATALTGNQAIGEEIAQDAFVNLSSRFAHLANPDG